MKSNTSVKIDREEVNGLIKNFVESKYGKLDKVEITFHDDSSNELTYVDVTFEGFKNELKIHKTDKADKSPNDLQNLPPSYFMNPLLSNEDKLEVRLADLIKRVEDVEYDEEACDKEVEVLEERVEELVKEVGLGNKIVEGHSVVITKLVKRVEKLEKKLEDPIYIKAEWNDSEVGSGKEDKLAYTTNLGLHANNIERAKELRNKESGKIDQVEGFKKRLFLNGWKMNDAGYFSHDKLKGQDCILRVAMETQEEWDKTSGSGKEDNLDNLDNLDNSYDKTLFNKGWRMNDCGYFIHDKIPGRGCILTRAMEIQEEWNKEEDKCAGCVKDTKENLHSVFCQNCAADNFISYNKGEGEELKAMEKGDEKVDRLYNAGWRMSLCGWTHNSKKAINLSYQEAHKTQDIWDKEAKAKRNKLKKNEDVETDEAYLTCYGWNTQCGGDGIIWVHPTIGEAINAKVAIRMQNDAIREKDSREKKAAEYLMSKGWTWDRKWFHPNIGSSSTLEGAMDMQLAFEKRDKIIAEEVRREEKMVLGNGWGVRFQ